MHIFIRVQRTLHCCGDDLLNRCETGPERRNTQIPLRTNIYQLGFYDWVGHVISTLAPLDRIDTLLH